MINAFSNKPYSADVRLILHANGQNFELAKVSSHRVVLRKAATLPPCTGELTISIDGNVTRHAINLPDGANPNSLIVRTAW